jgi:hypothetical protein
VTLYHYSASPFTFDPTRTYAQGESDIKPRGLWLSVDEGWKEWCEGEDFNCEGLTHCTEFALRPDARILHLSNVVNLDQFTYHYHKAIVRDTIRSIDWNRVAREWQGIIIAPYQWERRLTEHTFWYYGWDCASACVWDCSALEVK